MTLSRLRGDPPQAWRFRTDANGRPELDPPCGLRFSVSHCDGLVVCAVAGGRLVGVDAEPIARGDAILALAEEVFSVVERDDLGRIDEPALRRERATTLWTLKESYVKARGLGFSIPPASFTYRVGAEPVLQAPGDGDERRWTSRVLRVEEHVVALTVEGGAPWSVDIDEGHDLAGRVPRAREATRAPGACTCRGERSIIGAPVAAMGRGTSPVKPAARSADRRPEHEAGIVGTADSHEAVWRRR